LSGLSHYEPRFVDSISLI